MKILVFPDRNVKGYNGTPQESPQLFEPIDLFAALFKQWDTDAHAVPYLIPEEPRAPRLNISALGPLAEQNREPVLSYVFADVDNEGHKPWTDADAPRAAWEDLKQSGPPELSAACFYATRGGYRLLWRLADPIPASKAAGFLVAFFSYLREQGIPVDQECAAQFNTLARLPNVTRDGVAISGFIDPAGLYQALTWTPRENLAADYGRARVCQEWGPRPETWTRPAGLEWDILDGAATAKKHRAALRDGQPFAHKGNRNNTMTKIAGSIARLLGADNPAAVFRYMADSVAAWDDANAPTLDQLWQVCGRVVEMETGRRLTESKIETHRTEGQPPIVYFGSAYYIRETARDTYRPPVSAPAICQALEQWCKMPGIETRSPKGKPFGVPEYLARYGRQAVEVIAEMGRERAIFLQDLAGGTLIEGCCVMRRDVVPKFDPEVDQWLGYLGGKHADKLRDWLACAGRLDRPICAIYLEGPPGTGKGMIAAAVASLWGTGATSYADATGKFNAALARSPVVHVDEAFQVFDTSDNFSGAFRTLIGESERQLRRKNLPSATIRGCPRLIITANNADALRLSERLTKDDLTAIAQRILYVKHDRTAAEFLDFLGGREHTAHWVRDPSGGPGVITSHLAYLAKNREVSPGLRFLVEGEIGDWHRDLVSTAGIQGKILTALAHYVARGVPWPGFDLPDKPGGPLWVNTPSLHEKWGILTNEHAPSEAHLAKALRAISGNLAARRRTGGQRLSCYGIPTDAILRQSAVLQIGDPDLMLATLTPSRHNEQSPANVIPLNDPDPNFRNADHNLPTVPPEMVVPVRPPANENTKHTRASTGIESPRGTRKLPTGRDGSGGQ